MYAAVKFGKNMMGSYASQLDIKQRWMVIAYIKKMQADNGGDAFTMGPSPAATPVKTTDSATTATQAQAGNAAASNKKG
jgi:hypothetical protein